jgi:hypothetical protein
MAPDARLLGRPHRPRHRRHSIRQRLFPRVVAVLAIAAGSLTAPLSTGAAHAGLSPSCQACDTLLSTLQGLVVNVRVGPDPNTIITMAAQAVGEVTDCIQGNNTGCNSDLQELQQLIQTVQGDAQQCETNAPGSPCTTIVSDAQTIEQQIIDTSGTCLQDSASVCNAVIGDATTVVADAEAIASACLASTPDSPCETTIRGASVPLAEAQSELNDCLNDAASTCQQMIHNAIGDISTAESQAEALLSPPSDGGGATPRLDIHDFSVTTQGAGEQEMVYDALQNQYDDAYNVIDAPVSNVYELPVVPKQVTDTVDTAGNLIAATTSPEMQVILAQTGQDFTVASVHSEDGSLVGFTVADKALAPIGMPMTSYEAMGVAGGVGLPTTDSASGKWYKMTTKPSCFDDSSYAWTKTICSQFDIQDSSDAANYHFQFQYWAQGRAVDGYKVDKFWLEAVPDTHDTPGMQYDGAAAPTQAYDGTGSGCTSHTTTWNVTIGSGSPFAAGFGESTQVNSCEQYDPRSYSDTASHGHYAFVWYGNPAASTERYLKMNVALSCPKNANGVEYELWFGQRKYDG